MMKIIETSKQRNMRSILSGYKGVALLTGGGAAHATGVSNLIPDHETEHGEKGPRKTRSCSHGVANGSLSS